MSFESWSQEFYPLEAENTPLEGAVKACLKKWLGLRPANLKKHKVVVENKCVGAPGSFAPSSQSLLLGGSSCALCVHYIQKTRTCEKCPLAIVRDGVPCDETGWNGEAPVASPYDVWRAVYDPEPMIKALRAALRYEKNAAAAAQAKTKPAPKAAKPKKKGK